MASLLRRSGYRANAPADVDILMLPKAPTEKLVFTALVVSVFQIYTVPIAGFYVPLSLALSLLCIPFISASYIDRATAALASAYIFSLVVSLAWSPNTSAWANGVVYQSLFFIGLFSFRLIKAHENKRTAIRLFLIAASTNAIVTVLFRVFPAVKNAYLSTSMRSLFTNPNTVESVLGKNANVNDVFKSGGFLFSNGNSGAAFNMMCIGMTVCLLQDGKKGLPLSLFFIFLSAVIASGSKSALLVSAAVIGIATTLYFMRTNRFLPIFILGLIAIGLGLLMFSAGVFDAIARAKFSQDTAQTSSYRVGLLQVASILFRESPILGLGFGGWERRLGDYASFFGLSPNWPPHNSVVLAWAQAGIFSALILVVTFGYILAGIIGSYQRTSGSFRPGGALIAFLSVTAMSLGDPYPLFGNSSMAFPLGCVVAFGLKSRVSASVSRR